jgi:hypothetical protein
MVFAAHVLWQRKRVFRHFPEEMTAFAITFMFNDAKNYAEPVLAPKDPPCLQNYFPGLEPGRWRAADIKTKKAGAICRYKSAPQSLRFSKPFPAFARC